MTLIQAQQASVSIGGRPIFEPVDLQCQPGKMIALTGPSGSGKSTLLNCLGLIFKPSVGDVLIDSQSTASWNDRRRAEFWRTSAAFIYQDYGIIEDDTVAYNVTLARMPSKDAKSGAEDVLNQVGLAGRASDRASVLSGGEKQRLGVARAIYKKASVIYADEPTASLDEANRSLVTRLLRQRAEQGVTVILATHDERLVAHCDTFYELRPAAQD